MFGGSKLETAYRYSLGRVVPRARPTVDWVGLSLENFFILKCDGCSVERKTGLDNDHRAATDDELCVGAKIHGWLFTYAGQMCPKCRRKIHKWLLFVIPSLYFEGIMRLGRGHMWGGFALHMGAVIGISFSIGPLTALFLNFWLGVGFGRI